MNKHYQRYIKFIDSRKQRFLSSEVYTENHHIVPRSLGGSNEKENLIKLTGREHFIAHLMLWKAYGEGMTIAFHMMSHSNKYENKLTAHQYKNLKKDFSKSLKGSNNPMYGKPGAFLGKHHSEEHKKKISEVHKGKATSDETRKKMSLAKKGKPGHICTDETKQKLSKSNKGKATSEDHKQKISETMKGHFCSIETRQKMSESRKGKVFSEETRKKISEARKKYCANKTLAIKENLCL